MTENILPPDTNDLAAPYEGVEETSPAHEATLQYPAVQVAMDTLHRMVAEDGDAAAVVQYTEAGEPVLTPQIIDRWADEAGFRSGKKGTYPNVDHGSYLYIKYCHDVPSQEDIDSTLATARELTARGAIHPESQWSVFARPDGTYQLFVVSPGLEPWSFEEAASGHYRDRVSQPTDDLSHIIDWFKRIDPSFIPGQPIPRGSPLLYLNYTEASHPDNWGWDNTGALFPVDVEVIRPHDSRALNNFEPWVSRRVDPMDHYFF